MSHAYRGQKFYELFSTNNQLLLSKWKLHPNVKKVYDDQLKTYVYCLNGKSPLPLMNWPKEKINSFSLSNPVIVFQMYFVVGANVLITIGVSSYNNQRKRITLSSNQKNEHTSSLSVTLPLTLRKSEMWSHLIVDLENVVSANWKKEIFRNIDSLSVGGILKVKRIFTLRKDVVFNQKGTWLVKYDELPKHMSLPKHILHFYIFIPCSNSHTPDEQDSSDIASFQSSVSGPILPSSNSTYSESKKLQFKQQWAGFYL